MRFLNQSKSLNYPLSTKTALSCWWCFKIFFYTTSIFNYSVPLTSLLSIFAEAINTEAHLEKFKELGIEVNVDVDESVREIEKNLAWMEKKVPEIYTWVKNEKGGAGKLKFSIMIFIFSIILIVLQ